MQWFTSYYHNRHPHVEEKLMIIMRTITDSYIACLNSIWKSSFISDGDEDSNKTVPQSLY